MLELNPEKISSGGYADIYEVKEEDSVIKRNIVSAKQDFYGSVKELDILRKCRSGCKYIVRLKSIVFNDIVDIKVDKYNRKTDSLHFVLERADCDLVAIMENDKTDNESAKRCLYHCLMGLKFMNSMGIIHRDIKPSNILYFKDIDTYKLCDFGMCEYYSPNIVMSDRVCTMGYRAPELMSNQDKYTPNMDIWSMAVTIIEYLTRSLLFNSKTGNNCLSEISEKFPSLSMQIKSLKQKKKNYKDDTETTTSEDLQAFFSTHKIKVDEKLIDLISNMIQADPSKRFNVDDCLDHMLFDDMTDRKPKYKNGRNIKYVIDKQKRQVCIKYIQSIRETVCNYKHKDRMLYQALDIFDRCIEKGMNNNRLPQVCLYISCKLLYDFAFKYSFEDVTNKVVLGEYENLEKEIINKLGCRIYRQTIFEEYKDPDWDLFVAYSNLETGIYTLKDLKSQIEKKTRK